MDEKAKKVQQPDMNKAIKAFEEGMELLQVRELDKARERFEIALGFDDGNELARYQLGAVLAMQGKHNEALDRFEELVREGGKYAFLAQLEQGYVLCLAGRFEEAVKRLDASLKIFDEPWAWLFKSMVLDAMGKPDEAKKSFKKSVTAARREADGEGPCYWWSMEGSDMSDQGWLERALICFDVILRLDSKDYSSMEEKGCILRDMGRYKEALEWFNKALEVGQDDGSYWCMLYGKGLCLATLGRHKEAIELYDRVIANGDNDFDVLTDAEKARDQSIKAIAKSS